MSDRRDEVSRKLAAAREALKNIQAAEPVQIGVNPAPDAVTLARRPASLIQVISSRRTMAAERLAALLRDVPEIEDPQVAAAFRGVVDVLAALLGVEVEDAG